MNMKPMAVTLIAMSAMVESAFAGVGIHWDTFGMPTYAHYATNLAGMDDFLLDSYPATWQLVWAGYDCAIDTPDPNNGVNGFVSDDDQVWAQRTIPMGGGTAPEDDTIWDNWMTGFGGEATYRDPDWSTAGFVYMRVYEGPPNYGSWYYDSPLLELDLDYDPVIPSGEQDFLLGTWEAGIQPNQQITADGAYLYITNSDATVVFGVSNLTVGGEARDLDSGISWQNNLTWQSGYIDQPSGPWSFNCQLGVGRNEIMVSGYQYIGNFDPTSGPPETIHFSDTLVVVRSAAPRLDITNANKVVDVATSNLTVGGLSSNLVGTIGWTNSLGGSGTMAATAFWSFVCPLQIGTNLISARGTNLVGDMAFDVLTVVRNPGLGPPLKITCLDASHLVFSVPSGYALNAVQGADTQLVGREFAWSNLTAELHYTFDGTNVAVHAGSDSRQLIRVRLVFP